MIQRAAALLLIAVGIAFAQRTPVFPPDIKPVGPYTPGILTGRFLYVSGQGALLPGRGIVSGVDRQTAQCLENIKAIVTAAGLTMEHIVYTQVYMTDISRYDEMNGAYSAYFSNDPPARAVIGVARMPLDTPVEISAVAVRNLADKKLVEVRGMLPGAPAAPLVEAAGRLYVSGVLGRNADTNRIPESAADQVKLALDNVRALVKRAKRSTKDVNIATVYYTDNVPVEIVEREVRKELPSYVLVKTTSLPLRANVEITGIAAADLRVQNSQGATADMLKSFDGLDDAVVSNVYIDSIDRFAEMNKTYAAFFGKVAPTRTTVQPLPTGATKQDQITILVETHP